VLEGELVVVPEPVVVPVPMEDSAAPKRSGAGRVVLLLMLLIAAAAGWAYVEGWADRFLARAEQPKPAVEAPPKAAQPPSEVVTPPGPAPEPVPAAAKPAVAKKPGKKKRPAPAAPGSLTRDALLKRTFFLEKRVGQVMAAGAELDGPALLQKLTEARTGAREAYTNDERMAVSAELDDIEAELDSAP
jgi:hypothetical protein